MNLEEYREKMALINKERDMELTRLVREFALSNNTVKIGDIIQDHIGKIKVDSIGFYKNSYYACPGCTYTGTVLKKDGTPTKQLKTRTVYSGNLLK